MHHSEEKRSAEAQRRVEGACVRACVRQRVEGKKKISEWKKKGISEWKEEQKSLDCFCAHKVQVIRDLVVSVLFLSVDRFVD